MSERPDLLVIGSGGAAMAAAIQATELGADVVVVERGTVGGTCVNVGCVPSKFMLAAAQRQATALHNPFHGLSTDADSVNLAALVSQKDELIGRLRQHKYLDVAAERGFCITHGTARFTGETAVDVDGHRYEPRAVIVATGARPAIPELPGLDQVDFLTSTSALELAELPDRLAIVGAGFVGLEMAQLFARLGSHVTLIGNRVAPNADPELAAGLRRALEAEGITFQSTRPSLVRASNGGFTALLDNGETVPFDRLLIATGRQANVEDLDLTIAGVETNNSGAIRTGDDLRTSNPQVWAAGDVTASHQFVYVAAQQGRVAARNALNGTTEQIDYRGLPSVIFTTPALASAGLTETDARSAGLASRSVTFDLADVPRGIVEQSVEGTIKIVADPETRRLLGVHVLAPNGGELLLAATYAIKFGLTIDDVANTWAPYLTLNEGLRLAAQQFDAPGSLSCCA